MMVLCKRAQQEGEEREELGESPQGEEEQVEQGAALPEVGGEDAAGAQRRPARATSWWLEVSLSRRQTHVHGVQWRAQTVCVCLRDEQVEE